MAWKFVTSPGFEVPGADDGWPGNIVLDERTNPALLAVDPTIPTVIAVEAYQIHGDERVYRTAYVLYRSVIWHHGTARWAAIRPNTSLNWRGLTRRECEMLSRLNQDECESIGPIGR